MNNESLRVLKCLKISLRAFGSFECAICAMDVLQNEFEAIYKHSKNYCSGTVAIVRKIIFLSEFRKIIFIHSKITLKNNFNEK